LVYSVLPTDVQTSLPFASNGPFVLDPARGRLKDPAISPTNRWLLSRLGKLAATTMLKWLADSPAGPNERAGAYALMPRWRKPEPSLASACEELIGRSFDEAIGDRASVLTDSGSVVQRNMAVALPAEVFEIWTNGEGAHYLSAEKPGLSRYVSFADREKLVARNWVEDVKVDRLMARLSVASPPRPASWGQLLALWKLVSARLGTYLSYSNPTQVRIVPVIGSEVLFPAEGVVRIAEGRQTKSDDDWQFLMDQLRVLDMGWPRFLSDQVEPSTNLGDPTAKVDAAVAVQVLATMGLDRPSDARRIVASAASRLLRSTLSLDDAVRFAHVVAALKAEVPKDFQFFCRDGALRATSSGVISDETGALEAILPNDWCAQHLLHPRYAEGSSSCTVFEWQAWARSEKSGLLACPPLVQSSRKFLGRARAESLLKERGYQGQLSTHYSGETFLLNDWDFEIALWGHWKSREESQTDIWLKVGTALVGHRADLWANALKAQLRQMARNGSQRSISGDTLTAAWILKLRELPCLPDARGFAAIPRELCLRCEATEPLKDVERFVAVRLDTESARPLLTLLGVRERPVGPRAILDRLVALSKAAAPPLRELGKLYEALDAAYRGCSTEEAAEVNRALSELSLIFTDSRGWASSGDVFLIANEEDVPEAQVVNQAWADLSLWLRVGVRDRPTVGLALMWLKSIKSGSQLPEMHLNRVKAIAGRHGRRVWEETGHWPNLAGEWSPVEGLRFSMSMSNIVPYSHLFLGVRRQTADLRSLPAGGDDLPPFAALVPLAAAVEERVAAGPIPDGRMPAPLWIVTVAAALRRVVLEDQERTERVRVLADRLSRTVWQIVPGLEVRPHVDGDPAGTPREADAVWRDQVLFVADLPPGRRAKCIPDEIGKWFGLQEVQAALQYSFERPEESIASYMGGNFTLDDASKVDAADLAAPPTAEGSSDSFATGDQQAGSSPLGPSSAGSAPRSTASPEQDVEEAEKEVPHATETVGEIPQAHSRLPQRPELMERFAVASGFYLTGERSYTHPDGRRIVYNPRSVFPWQVVGKTGDVVSHLYAKEHCLEELPMEIPSETWDLLKKHPSDYSFVLTDLAANPLLTTGKKLVELEQEGRLTVNPAKYRLRIEHE
jgi:hypothetical protein